MLGWLFSVCNYSGPMIDSPESKRDYRPSFNTAGRYPFVRWLADGSDWDGAPRVWDPAWGSQWKVAQQRREDELKKARARYMSEKGFATYQKHLDEMQKAA